MMANSNDYLRPEARAIPYGKHHARARKALDFIIRALKEAAYKAKESKKEVHDVDPNRASRIIFVSGEPGSGKSTLYLTLKAMLGHEADTFSEGYTGPDLKPLKEIQWLDTLDLEVVGDEGENLLAAVLVRIFRKLEESKLSSKQCEDAIKKLEELATDIGIAWDGNLAARAGALDPDTFSMEVMRTQRARLGVNERLKEALDEISINNCCGCNVKTLFLLPVDDFYLKPTASLHLLRLLRMISIPRLFFLVMGDIDTVEALFTEKSLSDWTDVAGKELFAKQPERLDHALSRARELRARYLRKLLPPGQRADIEAMDWHEALNFKVDPFNRDSTIHTFERTLGNAKLDSPLPSGSQSLLGLLISPDFPYAKKGEVDEDEYQRHKEEEQKAQKEEDSANKDTRDQHEKNRKLIKHRSAYTALQILDATPREIMDLEASLREVEQLQGELKRGEFNNSGGLDQQTPVLLLSVRDIVRSVSEEQSFLNEHQQKILEGVLPTRHYSPQKEDIIFELDRLCLQPAARKWKKKEEGEIKTLWFRKHRSWDLGANVKHTDCSKSETKEKHTDSSNGETKELDADNISRSGQNPFAKLPPRPAAWFVLLHDLAWNWNPDSLTSNLIEKLCEDLNNWNISDKKVTERRDDDGCWPFLELKSQPNPTPDPSKYFSGWAVWLDKLTYRHLPIPELYTFREIDQFLYVWSGGLTWLSDNDGEHQVDIMSLWALSGWTILADLYEDFADKSDNWFNDLVGRKGGAGTSGASSSGTVSPSKLFDNFTIRLNEIRRDQKKKPLKYSSDAKLRIKRWQERGTWPPILVTDPPNAITKRPPNRSK